MLKAKLLILDDLAFKLGRIGTYWISKEMARTRDSLIEQAKCLLDEIGRNTFDIERIDLFIQEASDINHQICCSIALIKLTLDAEEHRDHYSADLPDEFLLAAEGEALRRFNIPTIKPSLTRKTVKFM